MHEFLRHPTPDSPAGGVERLAQRPGLVLWDLDGPIYDGHLIYDLSHAQVEDNLLDESVRDTILRHRDVYVLAEDPDYNQLIKDVNGLWAKGLAAKGTPVEQLTAHALGFMQAHPSSFRPYVPEAFDIAKRNGYRNVLLTNEPAFVAEAARQIVGADGMIPAEWETTDNDGLHGQLTGNILLFQDQQTKKEVAQKLQADRRQRPDRLPTLGFGDSSGDMDFLVKVDFPAVTFSHDRKILSVVQGIGFYRDLSGEIIKDEKGRDLRRIPDFNDGKDIVDFIRSTTSGNSPIIYNTVNDSFIMRSGLPLWMSSSNDIQLRNQTRPIPEPSRS